MPHIKMDFLIPQGDINAPWFLTSKRLVKERMPKDKRLKFLG